MSHAALPLDLVLFFSATLIGAVVAGVAGQNGVDQLVADLARARHEPVYGHWREGGQKGTLRVLVARRTSSTPAPAYPWIIGPNAKSRG
jgi:hypothetical protein